LSYLTNNLFYHFRSKTFPKNIPFLYVQKGQNMRGFGFSKFKPNQIPKGGFDELLKLFLELLNYTSGDAG